MKKKLRSFLDKPLVHAVTKHWLSLAFVLGFATDMFLLNQVDSLSDNLVLLGYVLLATTSLPLFYLGVAQRLPERLSHFCEEYMPVVMQYSFGGLLSGMLIFYGRSGDFFVSAPFLLLIMSVVFGNELIHKKSNQLLFHLTLYFIGVFAYLVLLLPILFGVMGDPIFVLSGLLALALIIVVVKLLLKIIPNFVTLQIRSLVFVIGGIYAAFNFFYFFNIIPPIPLSLTELRIYHDVQKTATGYRVQTLDLPWWKQLPYIPLTFSPIAGKGMFCFARVYAPTRIATDIVHHWEYYDEAKGQWQDYFHLSYHITGENARGYGGYTEVEAPRSGTWRCTVENKRGQVLGRRTFTVDTSRAPGPLMTTFE